MYEAPGGVPSHEILGALKLLLVVSRSSMGQLYRYSLKFGDLHIY